MTKKKDIKWQEAKWPERHSKIHEVTKQRKKINDQKRISNYQREPKLTKEIWNNPSDKKQAKKRCKMTK